jgi:hypothetical protein
MYLTPSNERIVSRVRSNRPTLANDSNYSRFYNQNESVIPLVPVAIGIEVALLPCSLAPEHEREYNGPSIEAMELNSLPEQWNLNIKNS